VERGLGDDVRDSCRNNLDTMMSDLKNPLICTKLKKSLTLLIISESGGSAPVGEPGVVLVMAMVTHCRRKISYPDAACALEAASCDIGYESPEKNLVRCCRFGFLVSMFHTISLAYMFCSCCGTSTASAAGIVLVVVMRA
jgi:hypothetical protein